MVAIKNRRVGLSLYGIKINLRYVEKVFLHIIFHFKFTKNPHHLVTKKKSTKLVGFNQFK